MIKKALHIRLTVKQHVIIITGLEYLPNLDKNFPTFNTLNTDFAWTCFLPSIIREKYQDPLQFSYLLYVGIQLQWQHYHA